jgi:hypothetical protein
LHTTSGLCVVADFEKLQPGTKAEKRTDAEVMQKDDNIPSAGTKADSEQKAEDIFASGNDTKPNVVGLPSLSDDERDMLKKEATFYKFTGAFIAAKTYKELQALLSE